MPITTVDKGMIAKGYRFRLTPLTKVFDPLYAKLASQVGPLMREYPDTRFEVVYLGKTRVPLSINGVEIGAESPCIIEGCSLNQVLTVNVELPDGTYQRGHAHRNDIDA